MIANGPGLGYVMSDGQASSGGSPPLRVLVVEDDSDTAISMALVLRLYGYDAQVVADGRTAIGMASTFRPDAILLDLALPHMDGYRVAKQLREQPCNERPYIIVISGYASAADRQRSAEVGIDLHLAKPVDCEDLHHLLERLKFRDVRPAPLGDGSA